MEVLAVQLVCLCALFSVMTVCGVLPVLLAARRRRGGTVQFNDLTATLISLCNCLAGGVFIGMCFLGLFPYVHDKFATILLELHVSTSFPVAECVIVLGFFLILTLEQLLVSRHQQSAAAAAVEVPAEGAKPRAEEDESYVSLLAAESAEPEPSEQQKLPPRRHAHSHLTLQGSGLRYVILLVAVSIHSLFEGIALGLQTDKDKILHLFLAILIHETLVAFALGVNLAKMNLGVVQGVKYVLTVTVSIPLGILLGLLIGFAPGVLGDIVSGLFQGVAAGIFIHVTFMELIPEEFQHDKHRLLKVLFFFLGFLVMALVNLALGDHK